VARYGLPEIWDSAYRDGQRGAESEGTLTPHSLLDSEVFDRFNEQTRRARRRIVRSLEMKGGEPRSMRVADRDFAVCFDGYTNVYHNAGQGYVTVPHRGVDELNQLLLAGGDPVRLIKWECDDNREKWTHCVDPQGRYVAMDVTTRGTGTTVTSWGSSTMGDLWNQVFCGRTTLKAAITKAKKSTDLTKGEATHVLGGKNQAEACARHHSFGKPVQCLSVPLKARVVGFGFDFAGIGVEIDAANDCCLATGMKMRSVYVSEIDPALRRVLVDNLAQDAFDAPLIGELAGFADGSTTASRVLVLYASPPCPQHKSDSNGVVTGHGVADTRDGMVALAAALARGQPAFLILENVPGTELQEGTIFLRGVAERCGGGAVTVERRCVDLGVPVSGGRVFTVFLNAVTVKYRAELVGALGASERKVRPLLCEWWKDETLSEKLKDPQEAGAAPYVRKIFPKHAWSTGRDDAPTKVGELLKNGRHYANIYDGEGLSALFKRPTRVANRLKGLGAYLFEGEIYIPTVKGAARYMGIKWNRLEGLDTRERLLALGNTVPTKLSSSVLRPVLLTLKRHPDIEGECENLAEQPPHVRDVVETHHVRINQPSYVAAYTHSVATARWTLTKGRLSLASA
jgi:site-specific DNA-cytosine methylase